MRDWDSVAALGAYLGIADAGSLAARGHSCPGSSRLLAAIRSAAGFLGERLSAGEIDLLLHTLAGTDYEGLTGQGGDRYGVLSADIYRRYTAASACPDAWPGFETFDLYFREYLRRFSTSVRAMLYVTGVRKEIISLEHPAIRQTIVEIGRLPCRSFGEISQGETQRSRFSMSLARYVQGLLERQGKGLISADECGKIMEIMDRVSAYPGYYRLVERERRVELARPLVAAISALRAGGAVDQEKTDLIAALGILLFSLFPSAGLLKFLAVHRPGTGNRYLLYEHYALLALNFFLMGKIALATGYCARALEVAPCKDMKVYSLVLKGCIALERQDHAGAIGTLEDAMDMADDRRQRSLVGFYLGLVRFDAGDIGLALNCFRDARPGAAGDTDVMSTYCNMGTCLMLLGDLGQALKAFEEAASRGTYTGRGSVKYARSVAYGNAGIVYMSMREYDLAKEHFTKALRDARQTGNARGIADQLMNIGLAHKACGDFASAATHFISALNYAYTIDYLEGVIYARDQIGQALALQGRHGDEDGIYRDIARRHPGIRNLLMRR
ncbi:MAG: Photosystem I assembly protein Ycf3 [Methanocella sp. PtaU1.Bin125]|nr:MAG: Photosystem I assembly protein Ycf3 [Methanocella sp. PtaU1.Bin125]